MAKLMYLVTITLFAAAAFSPLLPEVRAADCNAVYHSADITSKCSPGTSPSEDCCGAVMETLAAGGARCFCLASHAASSVSGGLTPSDYQSLYDGCGGAGDYTAEFRTCSGSETPPSTPPPPGSTSPPPPLPIQVEVVETIPWWHWILEWFLSLVAFLVLLILLFFMVKFCSGRGRRYCC